MQDQKIEIQEKTEESRELHRKEILKAKQPKNIEKFYLGSLLVRFLRTKDITCST